MVSEARREEIRRRYRALRAMAGKTQLEVEALARLDTGRFWKIENGVIEATAEERERIARVLRVQPEELPSASVVL